MDQTFPATLVTPVLVAPIALVIPIAPVILVNVLSPVAPSSFSETAKFTKSS